MTNILFSLTLSTLTLTQLHNISASIYKIEGGTLTRYPYGIKSINTNGNKEKARHICENTINHNFVLWNSITHKDKTFIDFLADRYCPISADRNGNTNWKQNIRKELK